MGLLLWAEKDFMRSYIVAGLADGAHVPPQGVQGNAKRALELIRDGKAGAGFTSVGRARARQLASGRAVSTSTVRQMHAYFARHGATSQGEDHGDEGPAHVAWLAWGGDAGKRWADSIVASLGAAQVAFSDLEFRKGRGGGVNWDAIKHPRDGRGRFINVGDKVDLGGGRKGTVSGIGADGKVSVKVGGKTERVDPKSLGRKNAESGAERAQTERVRASTGGGSSGSGKGGSNGGNSTGGTNGRGTGPNQGNQERNAGPASRAVDGDGDDGGRDVSSDGPGVSESRGAPMSDPKNTSTDGTGRKIEVGDLVTTADGRNGVIHDVAEYDYERDKTSDVGVKVDGQDGLEYMPSDKVERRELRGPAAKESAERIKAHTRAERGLGAADGGKGRGGPDKGGTPSGGGSDATDGQDGAGAKGMPDWVAKAAGLDPAKQTDSVKLRSGAELKVGQDYRGTTLLAIERDSKRPGGGAAVYQGADGKYKSVNLDGYARIASGKDRDSGNPIKAKPVVPAGQVRTALEKGGVSAYREQPSSVRGFPMTSAGYRVKTNDDGTHTVSHDSGVGARSRNEGNAATQVDKIGAALRAAGFDVEERGTGANRDFLVKGKGAPGSAGGGADGSSGKTDPNATATGLDNRKIEVGDEVNTDGFKGRVGIVREVGPANPETGKRQLGVQVQGEQGLQRVDANRATRYDRKTTAGKQNAREQKDTLRAEVGADPVGGKAKPKPPDGGGGRGVDSGKTGPMPGGDGPGSLEKGGRPDDPKRGGDVRAGGDPEAAGHADDMNIASGVEGRAAIIKGLDDKKLLALSKELDRRAKLLGREDRTSNSQKEVRADLKRRGLDAPDPGKGVTGEDAVKASAALENLRNSSGPMQLDRKLRAMDADKLKQVGDEHQADMERRNSRREADAALLGAIRAMEREKRADGDGPAPGGPRGATPGRGETNGRGTGTNQGNEDRNRGVRDRATEEEGPAGAPSAEAGKHADSILAADGRNGRNAVVRGLDDAQLDALGKELDRRSAALGRGDKKSSSQVAVQQEKDRRAKAAGKGGGRPAPGPVAPAGDRNDTPGTPAPTPTPEPSPGPATPPAGPGIPGSTPGRHADELTAANGRDGRNAVVAKLSDDELRDLEEELDRRAAALGKTGGRKSPAQAAVAQERARREKNGGGTTGGSGGAGAGADAGASPAPGGDGSLDVNNPAEVDRIKALTDDQITAEFDAARRNADRLRDNPRSDVAELQRATAHVARLRAERMRRARAEAEAANGPSQELTWLQKSAGNFDQLDKKLQAMDEADLRRTGDELEGKQSLTSADQQLLSHIRSVQEEKAEERQLATGARHIAALAAATSEQDKKNVLDALGDDQLRVLSEEMKRRQDAGDTSLQEDRRLVMGERLRRVMKQREADKNREESEGRGGAAEPEERGRWTREEARRIEGDANTVENADHVAAGSRAKMLQSWDTGRLLDAEEELRLRNGSVSRASHDALIRELEVRGITPRGGAQVDGKNAVDGVVGVSKAKRAEAATQLSEDELVAGIVELQRRRREKNGLSAGETDALRIIMNEQSTRRRRKMAAEDEEKARAQLGPARTIGTTQHSERGVANMLGMRDLPEGPRKQAAEEAQAAIAKVHSTYGMRPHRMSSTLPSSKNAMAEYKPTASLYQDPEIFVDPKYKAQNSFSITHEIGHAIDWDSSAGKTSGFPSRDGAQVAADPEVGKAMDAFVKAAQASDHYKAHKARRAEYKGIQTTHAKDVRGFHDYAMTNHELWARAYSQFIAKRSGDKKMIAAVAEHQPFVTARQKDTRIPAYQWDDVDFQAVDAAVEAVLKAKGWM